MQPQNKISIKLVKEWEDNLMTFKKFLMVRATKNFKKT